MNVGVGVRTCVVLEKMYIINRHCIILHIVMTSLVGVCVVCLLLLLFYVRADTTISRKWMKGYSVFCMIISATYVGQSLYSCT